MKSKTRILIIILAFVMASVILMTIFNKIQNKRISNLRKTLDSLETGKYDHLNQKYFNQDSADSAKEQQGY